MYDAIVDLPIEVSARPDRVSSHDFTESVGSSRLRCAMEVWREPAVPEERGGRGHVQFLPAYDGCVVPAVDKEVQSENGFAVAGEVAREDVGEVGVGRDSLLDQVVTVFPCDCEIVVAVAVAVAKVDELRYYMSEIYILDVENRAPDQRVFG
jgi:hypothetical protein